MLGFREDELKSLVLESGHLGDEDYYAAILKRWLGWAPPRHFFPTLSSLLAAIRAVGMERLANELELNFSMSCQTCNLWCFIVHLSL